MTDIEMPAIVPPVSQTISWLFDLCWPREDAALGDGFAALRVGSDEVELAAALAGVHVLDRLRALFRDTGSLAWLETSTWLEISTRALEELATRWPQYGAAGEYELLNAVRDEKRREETRSWLLLSERAQAALVTLVENFRLEPECVPVPALVRRIVDAVPEALARRREIDPAENPVVIQVCVNCFERRANAHLATELETMRVETGADGRLWVLRGNEESCVQRNRFTALAANAGPWLNSRPNARPAGFTLDFEDTRELLPGRIPPEYFDMLKRYGLELPELPGGEAAQATLHLQLHGDAVMAWTSLPSEREETYFESFRPMARAIQETMRTWLGLSWFWEFEKSPLVNLHQARLAYCATPPFRGGPREPFAYEILDERSRLRALAGARGAMPPLLDRARRRLLAAGLERRSRNYEPRSVVGIINLITRHRRNYDAYLLADAQTIDQFALLATAGRALRQAALREPARAARRLSDFMADFVPAFTRRFRRIVEPGELARLPSLLILEATRALAPHAQFDARLILRLPGRTIVVKAK